MKTKEMIMSILAASGFICFAIGGFLFNTALGMIVSGLILLIWSVALNLVIKEEKKKEKGHGGMN